MRWMWIVVLALAACCPPASACSGIAWFGDGVAIVGGNADQDPAMFHDASMWATARTEEDYGAVFFGLWFNHLGDRSPGWYEMQGVNDRGLYFDLFSTPCPPGGVRPVEQPPWWKPEPLEQRMLQRCATVQEALGFLGGKRYRSSVPCTQVLLVDRSGGAAVYTPTGVAFRDPTTSSFVVTNFDLATPSLGGWPCDRYDFIRDLLREDPTPTLDRVGEILSTVNGWTYYSVVCDLMGNVVDVYWGGDFTVRTRLDLVPLFAAGLPVTSITTLAYAPSGLDLPPSPLRREAQ